MKFRKFTIATLWNTYTQEAKSLQNNDKLIDDIVSNIGFNIDDSVIIKFNEDSINALLKDLYSEDFINKFIHLVRESTLIPLLMSEQGVIKRSLMHENDCKSVVRYAIKSCIAYRLQDYINIDYLLSLLDSLSITLSAKYSLYSSLVCIKIDDNGNIHQFVSTNSTFIKI